jgi:purine-binding chemotaxis protein CheW
MAEAATYTEKSAVPLAGGPALTGDPGAAVHPAAVAPKEFLTFRLGAQEYGIDVLKVQDIRGCAALACIDDAPDFIAGAIDFGGAMVPVIDLRIPLDLDSLADSVFTVAVILNLGERVLGLMVDSVSDVIRLARWQIRPATAWGGNLDAQYLIGIGIDDERKLILLDIEKLVLGEGMGLLEIEAY